MDIEALFDGKTPAEAPEPVAAAEPEQVPTPEAPAEPEPPKAEEPAPVPEPAKEEDPRSIPLPVFLDMRDKAKDAERRLAEYEARQAPPQEPAEMPNPADDPQGYAAWSERRTEQALVNQRFATSDLIARQQHGAETVEAAGTWAMEKAKADPAFAQAYMQEAHPIDWIVRQHKRDDLLKQIGEDPDDFVRRRAAELGLTAPSAAAVIPAPAGAQQAPKPASPPQSLASAPSKGGAVKDIPTGPMAALEAVFQR